MQELIILGLFVLALIYLYRKLFKNRGCDCSSKGGCATNISVKPPKVDNDKT